MKLCLHCQQPIPKDSLAHSDFCCYGCQAAYEMINNLNLNTYYQRRNLDNNLDSLRPDDSIQPIIIDDDMITKLSDNQYNLSFTIENLHCAACIWLIEQVLAQIQGVDKARVNLSNKILGITWQPQTVAINDIIAKLNQLGYKAQPYIQTKLDLQNKHYEYKLIQAIALLAFATANIMLFSVSEWSGIYLGINLGYLVSFHWLSFAISIPIILYAGRLFYIPAFKSLKTGQMGMDIPVTVAIIATIGLSIYNSLLHKSYIYFDASVILLFFLTVGRYLEHRTKSNSSSLINNLSRLQEQDVTYIDSHGNHKSKKVAQIKIDDIIIVQKNTEIPIDGLITKGNSHVNQAVLNGESTPQHLHTGDQVYAGTVNLSHDLEIQATTNSANTILAKLILMAQEHGTQNTKFITFAQRVIKMYIPTIHIIAVLSGLWAFATNGYDVADSVTRGVTVLLVTCPCALALAVPLMNSISNNLLFHNNIIIQGQDTLDKIEQSKHIFFDKTGTLTMGQPQVVASSHNHHDLPILAQMVLHSNHPYSKAIANHLGINKQYLDELSNQNQDITWQEITGYGISAQSNGIKYYVGSEKFIKKQLKNNDSYKNNKISELINNNDQDLFNNIDVSASIVWYLIDDGNNDFKLSFFACADALKNNIGDVIKSLQNLGFNLTILSGDNAATVAHIAKQVGINNYHGELHPLQKVELIEQALQQGQYPIMIGDGINDSAAMTKATVSISPSNAMHITKSHADILFRTSSLQPLLKLINIARQSQHRIRTNIYISLAYNIISIPIAIGGYLNPLIAAVLMSTSSIIVTLNSIRKME